VGLIETVTDVVKLAQKLDNIELNNTILSLQTQIMELLAEKQQLLDQVRECRKKMALKQALVYRDNAYWLPMKGGGEQGPYCTRCWDEYQLTIRRLHVRYEWFYCPKCKDTVDIPSGPGAVAPPPPELPRW